MKIIRNYMGFYPKKLRKILFAILFLQTLICLGQGIYKNYDIDANTYKIVEPLNLWESFLETKSDSLGAIYWNKKELNKFVHSDDFLASSDCLSNMAQLFLSENLDGVYGDLHYVDALDSKRVVRNWKSQSFYPELLNRGWMPAHPTLFLKKEVYNKHGVLNLDFKIVADYDMMLRIFKNPTLKFAYLPQVVTKMRLGGSKQRQSKKRDTEDQGRLQGDEKQPFVLSIIHNMC